MTAVSEAMRCPELVLALINNPVRADPMSAILYKNLCDIRLGNDPLEELFNLRRENLYDKHGVA